MKIIHRIALACALLAPSVTGMTGIANAAPAATFGIEVGNALLCLNQLNSKYFYDYLFEAFGKPYKNEGGAYWFKAAGSTIWGMEITDVLVNDSSSPADFIGAVVNSTPQALADAIGRTVGIRYSLEDNSKYSQRQSQAGSIIAYANTNAKIYCAKSKYLVPPKQ
ncbi:hypothetical protein PMI16_04097 [Herbaspirillum sp. CF444]|uniref:hypothetical protein n=1 Tax=Herbaspirillum sp. CF444 TaxID=1144319 RepID=UPI0002722DEC|nr:hypothetical protein [Herbaspirillum sp. CF444]EJL83790.1 hypothetical protein PMI16_04097 [Herbaspirillum sp. CF444]